MNPIKQKIIYKSGFVSIGYFVGNGWEHCQPINPDMHDDIVKAENVEDNSTPPATEERKI